MSNNDLQNISASLTYIRETEYQKFLELKKQNHLQLTDYTSIWRTLLLLLIAKKICSDESQRTLFIKRKSFSLIQQAIDEYYQNSFELDISAALQFADESSLFAKVINKHLNDGGEENSIISFTPTRFQANLRYIEDKLRRAIASVKTSKRHTLFIDGIDIRPASVPYDDYRECIAGLANAVWTLNNDVFASIKDPGGQCRIVLLIRPDILESLGLQNTNTKVRDNSVMLDWRTTYPHYRRSNIFHAIDRLLSAQQEEQSFELGECWDYYFPFNSPTDVESESGFSSFTHVTHSR